MNANDETANVLITSLDDYQKAANRTAADDLEPNIALAVAALGLAGEAGEAAEIVKKWLGHGHDLDRKALIKELGDTLWYVSRVAHLIGEDLSWVASQNIAKLRARYPQGFSTTESLKRCECGHHQDDHQTLTHYDPHNNGAMPCTQCKCQDYTQRTVA